MRVWPIVMRILVGLVLLGLLVLALRSFGWERAAQAATEIGPTALILTLAVTVASMCLSGIVWARVLRCLGYPVPISLGLTTYAATGLAAYLGAGVGAFGQCMVLLHRHGVCARSAAMLVTIATLICFCGSMIWAPLGAALLAAPAAIQVLPALGGHARLIALIVMAVCAAGAVGVLWLITLTTRAGAQWRIARFAVDSSVPLLRLKLHSLLALIPIAGLAWLIGALPLWLLVHSAEPTAAVTLPTAIAVQSLACLIGGMAFFLPNGLGARDGAIVALLVGVSGVPLPLAASVAALLRLSDPVAKALLLLGIAGMTRLAARAERQQADLFPLEALLTDTTAA